MAALMEELRHGENVLVIHATSLALGRRAAADRRGGARQRAREADSGEPESWPPAPRRAREGWHRPAALASRPLPQEPSRAETRPSRPCRRLPGGSRESA